MNGGCDKVRSHVLYVLFVAFNCMRTKQSVQFKIVLDRHYIYHIQNIDYCILLFFNYNIN